MQFHGDGAYEFKNPSSSYSLGGTSGIVAKARARGMLTIAALSPDKQGSVTWWEQGSANADYVRDLIRAAALSQYAIDTTNIWLVGYSGGAQFITQFFLPKHSSMIHGGGSVVFGGGGIPRVTVQPFAAALTRGFSMHWYTGLNDDGRNGSYNALRDARAVNEPDSNVHLSIRYSLTAGTKYYYQVERNSRSNVIAAGTFTTTR